MPRYGSLPLPFRTFQLAAPGCVHWGVQTATCQGFQAVETEKAGLHNKQEGHRAELPSDSLHAAPVAGATQQPALQKRQCLCEKDEVPEVLGSAEEGTDVLLVLWNNLVKSPYF